MMPERYRTATAVVRLLIGTGRRGTLRRLPLAHARRECARDARLPITDPIKLMMIPNKPSQHPPKRAN